ncbi:hypothetical protein E2P81_ATG07068 [Venturia nashicola]|uniref:Uncharacterized protein n=1 Tax=Venturia nashicola TaxID=86259 RepID=A0A4Z1NJL0_9PEZI|nr:hypothetical protein E6O75_ATG07232 [Venturia nashicola]TLD19451.1 hypothetical protein E2P81_ATG07068 [Venturia nashicola]
MLPLSYLFFLLTPATVLSAPYTGSNDGISNSETAASQMSGLVDNAAAAPRASFFVDPRHVIEMRHDQMSADTSIEIPPDQMSGTVRVHYDPDVKPSEANDEAELGTSPVPVSDLVKRSVEGISLCGVHQEKSSPHTTWYFDYAKCDPEKNERAYHVGCFHGKQHLPPIATECPAKKICFQVVTVLATRGMDIHCLSQDDAMKVASSDARGVIKTPTKFFPKPQAGYGKMLHSAFVFDRNGHSLEVISIVGVADSTMFTSREYKNSLITEKDCNPNGEGIYFQANPGSSYAVLEWNWKKMKTQ